MKARLDHPDAEFPPHYAITQPHRVVTLAPEVDEHGDETTKQAVALDVEAITTILTHHMMKFRTAKGSMELCGYVLPEQVVARIYMDAIGTLLAAHGITANLQLIEEQLCAECLKNALRET